MLTIVCGDNPAESRSQFVTAKQSFESKGYEVVDVPRGDLKVFEDQLAFSSTLFSEKRIYTLENVLSKKAQRDQISALLAGALSQSSEVIIWEESMDERSLKKYFPKAKILVSKLPHTLWKFIDGLYPGNLQQSVASFRAIQETVDPHLIHYMMIRRVKELLLVSSGEQPPKLASWQVGKLKQQTKSWPEGRLQSFFLKLVEIEMHTKSGTMVYPLDRALEVALCFYL